MTPAEKLIKIAENEQKVYDAGVEAGKAQGGDTDTAYNEGVEAGKKAQHEEFWENFLGDKSDYSYAFCYWEDSAFYPTLDIICPVHSQRVFMSFNNGSQKPFSLTERLKQCGKTLDTSNMRTPSFMFASSYISEIPELNFTQATKLDGTFNSGFCLETIEKIILKGDGTQTFTTSTFNTTTLKNIAFEGVIGTNIWFDKCTLLTAESYHSIITHCSKTATFILYLPPEATVRSVYDAKYGEGAWDAITAEYSNVTITYST